MKNKIWCVLSCLLLTTGAFSQKDSLPFKNTLLSFDERTDDLVGRLTMSEKLSQLFSEAPSIDRLGIPSYNWWNESLHGVARAGKATVFPQAIGLAATFNEALMFDVATAISDEARAKHNYFISHNVRSIYTGLTFWTPNINIFRDPRWGRGQETYGEDPFLTGRMAVNFIKGLQGNDPKYLKVIATAKHFAVHSGPEFSRHQDNVFVNDRDLYETYLPAFKAAVMEGHVQSVMCAYNRFRDQPCCGSNLLLSNILRRQFGFDGYIVSDCGAISDFYTKTAHHVVETSDEALGWSLSSGTDINCEVSKAFLPPNVDSAIKVGIINEKDINTSLHRLFKARFMLGMFDPEKDVAFNKILLTIVGNKAHLNLSLAAAEQSLVLLKNDGILPLKNIKTVAVIGPNADNIQVLLGNYNGQPVNPITPLAALQKKVGAAHVLYAPGCPMAKGVYTNYEAISSSLLFHDNNGKLEKGLDAAYFSNTNFEGKPTLNRTDSAVDFNWIQSPLDSKVEDQFSVRWSGVLVPSVAGRYLFGGNTEVQIDNKPLPKDPVYLEAGKPYKIKAEISVAPFWYSNTIQPSAVLSWVNTSRDYQKEALEIARKADVIIFCGGISPQLEGEEMPLEIDGFSHGDRTHLNLPAVQEDLLKQLSGTGKKIVYVNFSGSAVALNWEDQNLSAIVQSFYPGEAAGIALTNTLFGDVNFSGKLPVTFYRSVNDLPSFKDYSMKGRTYRFFKGDPLYAFGYGLSYTSFKYQDLQMASTLRCADSLFINTQVTNTGRVDGEEVIEVYLSHNDSSLQTPLRSLAGFKKVFLKAGETKQVNFAIKPDLLSVIDNSYNSKVLPGKVDVYVGGSQPTEKSLQEKLVMHKAVSLY